MNRREILKGAAIIFASSAAGAQNIVRPPSGTRIMATTVEGKLQQTVSVIDFMTAADVGTNNDVTYAFSAAHTYSVAHGFPKIIIPAGTYNLSSLNISNFVQFKAIGEVVLNCSLGSGIAFHISSEFGQPAEVIASGQALDSFHYLFDGGVTIIATNLTTTATCFFIGASCVSSAYTTRNLCISGCATSNFAAVVEFGTNCYLIKFNECNFLGNYSSHRIYSTNGIAQSATSIFNSGENIVFNFCLFEHLSNAIINNNVYGSNALEIKFNDCSFDQCIQTVGDDISVDKYTFLNCHIEGSGTTTQFYVSGNVARTSGDMVLIDGGLFYGPQGVTYVNPLIAAVKNYGRLVIRNMVHSLGSATVRCISVDSVSAANVEDKPTYANFSYIPTNYIGGATPINLNSVATCQTVTYTPTWTSDGGTQVIGASTIIGEYYRIGNRLNVRIKFLITTSGSWNPGTGTWHFGLPFGFTNDRTGLSALGVCFITKHDLGANVGICRLLGPTGNLIECYTTVPYPAIVGASFPSAWVTNDYIEMEVTFTIPPQ